MYQDCGYAEENSVTVSETGTVRVRAQAKICQAILTVPVSVLVPVNGPVYPILSGIEVRVYCCEFDIGNVNDLH